MDALHEGVALFDADDRFVCWNRRYAQIYGVTAEELRPGLAFAEFVRLGLEGGQYLDAVGQQPAWLAEREAAAKAGAGVREHLPGDRWVRVRTEPLPEGGRLRVVADTTGVQRNETSFRLLFEANPVPMCVVDARTLAFVAVNEAAVVKYGYPRETFLTMTMVDLAPPEVKGALKEIMTSALGGYDGQAVWTHMIADGNRIHIRPYVRPLTYEGQPALLCGAMDVTETVRAEAELRRARDAAESAQRTEADASAALREALRGPLETAVGSAEALAAVELEPEARALATIVREAVLRLERALEGGLR